MRLLNRLNGLKIRGKLIASFGLAMVVVLSALGTVTYLTFADSVLTSQARIASLQAHLAQRVVEDAVALIEHDLQLDLPRAGCAASESTVATDAAAPFAACAARPGAASPALLQDIQALGLPEAVGLLLSTRAGQWLVLKPGVADATQLSQAFIEAAPELERLASTQLEPQLVHRHHHYLLSTRLAHEGWQLHYAVPEALYQTDLLALKNRVIAATVVVLWVSAWIVLIIAQRLALPVRNLSAVMSAAGQRIEDTPALLLTRGDEIGELARSFDAMAARIRSLIHIDPLTQLFNRRYATQVLSERLADAIHQDRPLICLIMDVDFFKSVNDECGHPCGDQALIHCANVIRAGLRKDDVMARHGGEEFLVILSGVDLEEGSRRADELRQRLEQAPLSWEGQSLELTISVGVGWITEGVREAAAQSPEHGMAQLIEEADQALYEAKRRGRNRTLVRQSGGSQYRVVSAPLRDAAPISGALRRAGRESDEGVERAEA